MGRMNRVHMRLVGTIALALALTGPTAASGQDLYRVRMVPTGTTMDLATDCAGGEGYVLATGEQHGAGGMLKATGQALEPNGTPGPPLFLNLLTDVAWTRRYDAGRGLSGIFSGCSGETYGTNGNHGGLFIEFGNRKGRSYVHFTWHYDYYVTPGNVIREHFTLTSEDVPFPAWSGADVSGRVSGTFDISYYLKEGRKILSGYESITGGVGRYFEFDLLIEKVQ